MCWCFCWLFIGGVILSPAQAVIVRWHATTLERFSRLNDPDLSFEDASFAAFVSFSGEFDRSGNNVSSSISSLSFVFEYDTELRVVTRLRASLNLAQGLGRFYEYDRLTRPNDFVFVTTNNGILLEDSSNFAQHTSLHFGWEGALPDAGGRVELTPFNDANSDFLTLTNTETLLNSGFLQSDPGVTFVSNWAPGIPDISPVNTVFYGGVLESDLEDQPFNGGTEAFLFGTVIVPEPSSSSLLLFGVLSVLWRRRR